MSKHESGFMFDKNCVSVNVYLLPIICSEWHSESFNSDRETESAVSGVWGWPGPGPGSRVETEPLGRAAEQPSAVPTHGSGD